MRVRRGNSSAFTNPSLHLRMFKLSNPYVQWAIAHGAYLDTAKRPPTGRDFGDQESLDVARKIGVRPSWRPEDQYGEM